MDKRKVKYGSPCTIFRNNGEYGVIITDRYAATVVDVVSHKEMVVRRNEAWRTDFIKNKWTFDGKELSKDHPEPYHFTLRNNGTWVEKGMSMNNPEADTLTIGYRDHFEEW